MMPSGFCLGEREQRLFGRAIVDVVDHLRGSKRGSARMRSAVSGAWSLIEIPNAGPSPFFFQAHESAGTTPPTRDPRTRRLPHVQLLHVQRFLCGDS